MASKDAQVMKHNRSVSNNFFSNNGGQLSMWPYSWVFINWQTLSTKAQIHYLKFTVQSKKKKINNIIGKESYLELV